MRDDPAQPLARTALVAVAVATFERPHGLRRLLRALEAQSLDRDLFEVVVVDDHSSQATVDVLEVMRRGSPLTLHVVRFDRNMGPAAARNAAWRASTAPIVAFTDDDCSPAPNWLKEGLRAMDRGPSIVVGATEPDPDERHLIAPLSRTMRVERATFAPTCNVFYLRSDLEAVAGFDESFRVPVGEDTDLAWRVVETCGRELTFSADALVYHDVRQRSFKQAVSETYRWAGIPPVVKRHPELARRAWHRGYFLRTSHPKVILATLGLATMLAFPPCVLLALPWVRQRVFPGRPSASWLTNLRYAPALFAIDVLEVVVLLRGSLQHRTLIL